MSDTRNMNIKADLDTRQFNSSVDGMKKELRELQKIDLTILSDADAKKVINRMGELKDSVQTIDRQMKQADPGAFFQSFSTLASPAISALSTMTVGMRAFGMESEKVDQIQQKLMVVISALSTLQTISDANKLKVLVQQLPLQAREIQNRIKNTLMIKGENAAIVQGNVARATTGQHIRQLTTLQRIWNAVVAQNPITAVVAGVLALGGAIFALTRYFKNNNDEIKENEKALNGVYIANENMRKTYDSNLKVLQELQLEYRFLSGEINESQLEMEKLTISIQNQRDELNKEYQTALEETAKKTNGFWNSAKNYILSLGDAQRMGMRNLDDFGNKTLQITKDFNENNALITETEKQKIENITKTHNKRMLNMVETLNQGLIESDIERLRVMRDRRLRDVSESLADEQQKADAVAKIYEDFNVRVQRIESQRLAKQEEQRKKSIESIQQFTSGAFKMELDPMQKELQELTQQSAQLRRELMSAFEGDLRSDILVNQLNEINLAVEHQVDAIKQKYNELFEENVFDFRIEQNLVSLREMEEDEIKSITERANKLKISEEDTQQVIQGIRDRYRNQEIEEHRKFLLDQQDLGRDMNKEIMDFELKQLRNLHTSKVLTEEEYLKRRNEIRMQYDDEYAEQELNKQRFQNEIKIELENMLMTGIQGLTDMMHQNRMNQIQEEMEKLQSKYSQEREELKKQLRFELISETEYNQRLIELDKRKADEEKKLRIQSAKAEKKNALYNIAINTAVAIVKALADLGPILGAIMGTVILATGGVQAALVSQQQIPSYRVGSKDPFEIQNTGIANLHKGEMVVRPEAVDIGMNKDIIRGLNNGTYRDLRDVGGMDSRQVIDYIDLTLQKYHEKEVFVRLNEIENALELNNNIRVKSEQ